MTPLHRHSTRQLLNPTTETKADIDENICDLIQLIWNCGILTDYSCECETNFAPGSPILGKIAIGFLTMADAEKFFNIVCDYRDISDPADMDLYNAVCSAWDRPRRDPAHPDAVIDFIVITSIGDANWFVPDNAEDFPKEVLAQYKPHYVRFKGSCKINFDPKYKAIMIARLEDYLETTVQRLRDTRPPFHGWDQSENSMCSIEW